MRNTSPVGWRVTRYDYINRQKASLKEDTEELLLEDDVDLTSFYLTEDDFDLEGENV